MPTARPFTSLITAILTIGIVVPMTFFMAPPRAHAIPVYDAANFKANMASLKEEAFTAAKSAATFIKETLIEVHTYTSMVAEVAQYVNTYVLQPLAFILSGKLMKMLTAAVLAFVTGKANGTGIPQFILDVQRSIQTVQDGQALAFLKQASKTGSPFAWSISSALSRDYLSGSTLAGFWASNMCTLNRSSSNVQAYLAGNWSQGGIAAWFALTTQSQNNPFAFYQTSRNQLATVVTSAAATHITKANWGQGFLSWCGPTDSDTSAPATSGSAEITSADAIAAKTTCLQSGGSPSQCQAAYDAETAAVGTSVPVSPGGGINPGEPCTNKDGTPGTIKTPGTVIKATLDKVLGGQQDEIVRMGNVGPEINGILSDIGTVIQTVNLAANILGGNKASGSGGLLGAGGSSNAGSYVTQSQIQQLQNSSGYLGVTNTQVYQHAATNSVSGSGSNSSLASRVSQYQASWNSISSATNSASSSVSSLISYCTAQMAIAQSMLDSNATNSGQESQSGNTVDSATLASFIVTAASQISSAKSALTYEIAPVFSNIASANAKIATANAAIQKVQDEVNAGTQDSAAQAAADSQALQTMSPTNDEVVAAQQDAQAVGNASANPDGSLNVTTGQNVSIVDQMNLIGGNAQTLKSSCAIPTSSSNSLNSFGGGG